MKTSSTAFALAQETLCLALDALGAQSKSVILVGAQAIYQHTSHFQMPVEPFTTDADLLLDSTKLLPTPGIAKAMEDAGFTKNQQSNAVGSWISEQGIPVDLMMTESQAGNGRRAARVTGHGERSVRKTSGLESALHDNKTHEVACFTNVSGDPHRIAVAGPASLIIAKLFKLQDRIGSERLVAKDAHDIYRILISIDIEVLADKFNHLRAIPDLSFEVETALSLLVKNFAESPSSPGAILAGKTEALVGNPEQVQNRVWALSRDLVDALG